MQAKCDIISHIVVIDASEQNHSWKGSEMEKWCRMEIKKGELNYDGCDSMP